VGLANHTKIWTQLIPNSQMIVVPQPVDEPDRWKAQLFVTPSKLILKSVFALSGICLFILIIILVLYVKEKREDKAEKLAEAHRFHFDAM
jgi:integrin alpha FG-GAP repeat containing protein 1